ncbi:hypothetical protein K469DRAFT_716260 [Zopfia rhizophila CBS 207.26]|uniref:Uncharacterized protein n=1 Tax=Zopfia rhizophila CBS 207.26 TaxID=1314779 RepID=A0A6A6DNF2_9PEZI|nr:hypothetical protein K469DRAFT_716260 [Zopfia rhizophila CBS 207.26]
MGKLSMLEMRVNPEAIATSNNYTPGPRSLRGLAHDLDATQYNAQDFIGTSHKARDYHEAEEDLEVTEEDNKAVLKTRVVQKSARRRL